MIKAEELNLNEWTVEDMMCDYCDSFVRYSLEIEPPGRLSSGTEHEPMHRLKCVCGLSAEGTLLRQTLSVFNLRAAVKLDEDARWVDVK